MLWQLLFDEYVEKGADLKHMDNILIDLKYCQKICEDILRGKKTEVIFGWCFHHCGLTDMYLNDNSKDVFDDLYYLCTTYTGVRIIHVDIDGATIVSDTELEGMTEDAFRSKINA
jgi:hypothetical protein